MAIWSRLTTAIAGIAIGGAGSAAVNPVLEVPKQQAWHDQPNRILDLDRLAHLIATGLSDEDTVKEDALRNGYSVKKLRALVQLALEAPPYVEVLDLWRRNATRPADEQLSEAQVDHALAKAGIERQYWPSLKELINSRLSAPEIALAIVRGLIPDPGILPVSPPSEVGKVKAFPTFDIDALAEAAATGFDKERLSVYVGTMGRPMAVNEAARATFRDIIERVDFDRAIAEGDIRNEWRDALFDVARQIPTAHDFIEMRLRGWYDTDQQMYDGTSLHGMSEADTDVLFKITGRPLSWHQVFVGLRRGGIYNGPTDQIDPAFLKALRESNIRPEWYNLAWAQRFNLPSVFVIRQFLKDGGDPAWAQEKLWQEGWQQSDIDVLVKEYSPKASSKTDSRVTSAQTKLITGIEKAFVGGVITDAQATTQLEQAGLSATTAAGVLAHWQQLKTLEAIPPPAAA